MVRICAGVDLQRAAGDADCGGGKSGDCNDFGVTGANADVGGRNVAGELDRAAAADLDSARIAPASAPVFADGRAISAIAKSAEQGKRAQDRKR